MGRMGGPEEVCRLCLYIAAEATFTTGVDHVISGGAEGQDLVLDKRMVLFSAETRLPQDESWVFTDLAAAQRAQAAGASQPLCPASARMTSSAPARFWL